MTFIRIGAAVAAALLLVGCSSESDGGDAKAATEPTATTPAPIPSPSVGLPDGTAENPASTAGAGISPDGKLWVVTFGSSTNPLAVTNISADGQTVTLALAAEDRPATMDLVPSTSTIALPAGVDPKQTITVVLGDKGSVTLPPSHTRIAWLPPVN